MPDRVPARAWALLVWPFVTACKTLSNVRAVSKEASPKDVIPPWVYDYLVSTLRWFRLQFPRMLGYRATPYEQMAASIVVAVALVVVSIGTLTYVAPVMLLPFMIGATRLVPPVDKAWPLASTNGETPV